VTTGRGSARRVFVAAHRLQHQTTCKAQIKISYMLYYILLRKLYKNLLGYCSMTLVLLGSPSSLSTIQPFVILVCIHEPQRTHNKSNKKFGRLSVVRACFFLGGRSQIVLFRIPLIGDRMREVAGGGVQGREDVTGETGYTSEASSL